METFDVIREKVQSLEKAKMILNGWRIHNQTVVFTNGCFDIMHQGHVEYLAKASDLGTKLVLGINSDESVKRQGKGADRPVNKVEARAVVLAGIGIVDLVVVFDTDTPYDVIAELMPDVLVKGGDWELNSIVGKDIVEANGGLVTTIPFVEGFSTTGILEKIRD